MAHEQNLDPLEAGIILESLRPIVEEKTDYSDERWGEMTEREVDVVDDRLDEIEDDAHRYSAEEVAEELGINLDSDDEPDDAFLLAVGAVATGHESLPEAVEKRDVDAEDVARTLSRHAHYADYDGRLWADRRCDDADLAAERTVKIDDGESPKDIDALIDDLPDDDDDAAMDVRSAEEISEANGVDAEIVERDLEAMAEMAEDDKSVDADEAVDRLPTAADFDAEFEDDADDEDGTGRYEPNQAAKQNPDPDEL